MNHDHVETCRQSSVTLNSLDSATHCPARSMCSQKTLVRSFEEVYDAERTSTSHALSSLSIALGPAQSACCTSQVGSLVLLVLLINSTRPVGHIMT